MQGHVKAWGNEGELGHRESQTGRKTHRPMSKRHRRHKPGAKKPQSDGQMCFIQQQGKTVGCALHFQTKKKCAIFNQVWINELTKKGKIKKHAISVKKKKNNPPHMKHCFAFNHAVIVNVVQNLATSSSFEF